MAWVVFLLCFLKYNEKISFPSGRKPEHFGLSNWNLLERRGRKKLRT